MTRYSIPKGEVPRMKSRKDVPVYQIPHDELVPDSVFRALEVGPDWGTIKLRCPDAWAVTKGEGVRVFVLDTGIDANHPDLKPQVGALKDFTGSQYGPSDHQGHGTHCAGVVSQVAPKCTIGAGKVLDDRGSGGVDDIADGIDWAVSQGSDVISMSLGGPTSDNYIPSALRRAVEAGVIVVVAAGNDGPREGTIDYPGAYGDSLAVAAVDSNLTVASFSSRGASVFIAAPGVNVRSTYPGGQYATMSGTSMATPHVAGLAALWVAAAGGKKDGTRSSRFRTALAGGRTERTTAYGYGFPDAAKLTAVVSPPEEPVVLTLADFTAAGVEKLRRMLK